MCPLGTALLVSLQVTSRGINAFVRETGVISATANSDRKNILATVSIYPTRILVVLEKTCPCGICGQSVLCKGTLAPQ